MTPLAEAVREEVPPLVAGDRLTRDEFERRYEASPHIRKAELIDGVVYVPSPAKNRHAEPHGWLATWLGLYVARTAGVAMADNGTVRLDEDNEPQPDVLLRSLDSLRCHLDADEYISGGPELAVEVAYSSTSYDLHQKKEVYRRNGVREYVVLQARERAFRWFELVSGRFEEREPDPDGVYRSRVFPGLWLDARAFLDEDLATVVATLEAGIEQRDA